MAEYKTNRKKRNLASNFLPSNLTQALNISNICCCECQITFLSLLNVNTSGAV